MHVINDIQATEKSHLPVHHAQFAMTACDTAPEPWIETAMGHAQCIEVTLQSLRLRITGAHPIGNHINHDTTRSSTTECSLDRFSRLIRGKNIGFKTDFALRSIKRCNQRRKVFRAAMQQENIITTRKTDRTHVWA